MRSAPAVLTIFAGVSLLLVTCGRSDEPRPAVVRTAPTVVEGAVPASVLLRFPLPVTCGVGSRWSGHGRTLPFSKPPANGQPRSEVRLAVSLPEGGTYDVEVHTGWPYEEANVESYYARTSFTLHAGAGPGAIRQEFELDMLPAPKLELELRDHDGDAVHNIEVALTSDGEGSTDHVRITNDTGEVVFPGLVPGREYCIEVTDAYPDGESPHTFDAPTGGGTVARSIVGPW